ncbi:MAG: FKBP-type peptidyl-prolyl cis-trans isomerase [Gemmatimonadales bacterium]|nr:MAG: FKBP-type peptidyl-prolyl cis-trans isomerase [Gemmatimonadales bacterium]
MRPSKAARRRIPLGLVLLALLASCGDDPLGPRYPEDVNFAPALGIDLDQMTMLDSGVYVQTTQEGEGLSVTEGDVTVAYTLWLPDGTEVDSGELGFTFGANQVIPGFELGVSGMRVGEIRKIVIPSELAYGSRGTSRVPPHSVLVFEVELITGAVPA